MINVLLVIAGIIGMELFVVLFHRYVMHGLLWRIHSTHHNPTKHPLELNDVFVGFFMSIAFGLMIWGFPDGAPFLLGVGVAIYGTAYFIMHDMVIHKRFLRQPLPKNRYLQAVYRMHMAHHRHVSNDTGEAYGMFFVTPSYWRKGS
ncbi:MAG: hypothetical protein RIR53_894 [Bacteroidota bacterium]